MSQFKHVKHAIQVENLAKSFTIRHTQQGMFNTLKGLFRPKTETLHAINHLNFEVKQGEKVAFIGPNGAGKSTTIKMLTGILHPSEGMINVLGFTPWKERRKLGYRIGTVFGQRSQLWYHLPAADTFSLLSKIYEIPQNVYQTRLKELTETFSIGPLLSKPVRQLSLGERMRCEIVASLLHRPDILFLDEPTIGLDINGKLMIRNLLNKLAEDHGTTIFLTSHDTADIEQICERVLILDKGALIMDSSINNLKRTFIKKKIVSLVLSKESISLNLEGVTVRQSAPYHYSFEVDLAVVSLDKVIHEALKESSVLDITIEDPTMEEIIREIYNKP